MADGWGGRRKGAGRKPGLARIIREKALADAGADAEYALGLHIDVMRDEGAPLPQRLVCGQIVMDRVWGRAAQSVKAEHKVEFELGGFRDELEQLLARVAATGGEADVSRQPDG